MENYLGNKKTLWNIVKVSLSNIIKLLAGVLVGFLLPKIIGITDYGYYKTFTLYSMYIGLFHFGFADGIYLKFGGKNFDELDKGIFRFYTRFFIFLELFLSIVLGGVAVLALREELRFIFICLAVFLLVNNLTVYFQYVSQITGRFNELSIVNTLQWGLTAAILLALWGYSRFQNSLLSYHVYTMIYVGIMAVLAAFYMIRYRTLVFGAERKDIDRSREILLLLKMGFPLMIANLCSSLILTLDRQFVNALFDTDTYAVYAFAYNMLSLVTTATAAISVVLYPMMKRTDEEILKRQYSRMIAIILVLVSFCLLIYYPLCWFVDWFLPQYAASLLIFRIIFPGLSVSSCITIVMHNYYKTLNRNFSFFIISVVILIVSSAANVLAYLFWGTPAAVSVASIAVMILWYLVSERFFVRNYGAKWKKNFLFMLVSMAAFYGVTCIENYAVGFLLHVASFLILVAVFYLKDIHAWIVSSKMTGRDG